MRRNVKLRLEHRFVFSNPFKTVLHKLQKIDKLKLHILMLKPSFFGKNKIEQIKQTVQKGTSTISPCRCMFMDK